MKNQNRTSTVTVFLRVKSTGRFDRGSGGGGGRREYNTPWCNTMSTNNNYYYIKAEREGGRLKEKYCKREE